MQSTHIQGKAGPTTQATHMGWLYTVFLTHHFFPYKYVHVYIRTIQSMKHLVILVIEGMLHQK